MLEDYVSLYLDSPFKDEPPISIISLMFVALARLLPLIVLSPFFGAKVLPHPVKVALGLSLFAIIMPHMLLQMTTPLQFNTRLLLYVLKEMMIGLFMGFLISMPFYIVQGAGVIVDHQRGGSSLMVNDPTIQNQASPIGTLYNQILIFIFYFIGGPFVVIEMIIFSYSVVPPDQFLHPSFYAADSTIWIYFIGLFNRSMELVIQMAAPALIAILMTDSFLGIINRLAPQVQITFLGMPLKSLLALLLVWMGLNTLTKQMGKETMIWLENVKEMVGLMGGPG